MGYVSIVKGRIAGFAALRPFWREGVHREDGRFRFAVMDIVKQHFEEAAREYDRIIVALIPEYRQMAEALIAAVPFESSAPLRVMDVGCGTGMVAERFLQAFPNAQISCLDLSESMLAIARARLAGYPNVRYYVGDCAGFEFAEEFDAVVSSLALHHLATDQEKERFYRRIYNCLAPGGIFYNADLVRGSNDFLQNSYMERWQNFMKRNLAGDEAGNAWITQHLTEDRPSKLIDQLQWMAEIGFADVEVVWKYYNFAVYGGVKPAGSSSRFSPGGSGSKLSV